MKKKELTNEEILREIQEKHNHSWYDEIYLRNKDNLDDVALIYRGYKVTYREMFAKMDEYAKAFKQNGVQQHMEVPVCISNTPELVYILGGISKIGAQVNIFNEEFDKEYITEIIDGCDSDFIIVEDGKYEELKSAIEKSHVSKVVMTSLCTSLPTNPYDELDKVHGKFVNKIPEFVERYNVQPINEFLVEGELYTGPTSANVSLDDVFTTTYSSGSTNSSRAKAIVHTVRSFITIGRCHDPEIQKSASMKDFTIQAHIPSHSNTDIISSISDGLMQGSKIAMEPIYDEDFFLNTLLINKPNYIVATRSFWLTAAKKIESDERYKNVKLPFLLIPFSVGEPLDLGEEKYLNKILRKVKAGIDLLPVNFSPITMSVAGGDCEHGGIFWTLFRGLKNKLPRNMMNKREQGLMPFEMVETAILDENGNVCPPNTYGRLVANSPCNMKEYKNNPEATEKFFIKDATGKVWGDCSVYSYIDETGGIHLKGRIPTNSEELPPFMIADEIIKDTKNVLSCEVVQVTDVEAGDVYIAHIELQPHAKVRDPKKVMAAAQKRCEKKFGEEVADSLYFRLHSYEEGYKLTGCGKRDKKALEAEGLTKKCEKIVARKKDQKVLKKSMN